MKKLYVDNFVKHKTILRTQQRFKNEMCNVFTEVINKITLSTDDDKRMQSMNLTEIYAYGTSKVIIHMKEKKYRWRNIAIWSE